MKKILLLVLLLLLGAGGYLGYEYAANKRTPAQVLAKLQGKEEKKVVKELPPEPIAPTYKFVDIPSIAISISDKNRVQRILAANIVLEVETTVDPKTFDPKMPQLRDAFLSYLYKYMAVRETSDNLVDDKHLQARLRDLANQIMEKPLVHNVLMQASFERKV
jgi:flagellar basal body-associated protein FliL